MMKEYEKPIVEVISLVTEEKITTEFDNPGGEPVIESNTLFD